MAEETLVTEVEEEVVDAPETLVADNKEEVVETKDKVETKEDDAENKSDGKADEDKAEGAPEEYEAFTLPEGMVADEAVLAEFLPLAKELNLTQEQAQKFVDMQTKGMATAKEAQDKAWTDTMNEWQKASKDDKEIGGTKLDENLATAKKAISKFGTKEFKEMLQFTGMGNHPEVIRFLYKVGKAVSEDTIRMGGSTGTPKTAAELMFPTMNK